MKRNHLRFLSLALFILGVIFLLNSKIDITGAVVGVSVSSGFSSILGLVLILVSVVMFMSRSYDEIKRGRDEILRLYERGRIDEIEFAFRLNQVGELTGGRYNPGGKSLSVRILGNPINIPNQGNNSDLARALHARILENSSAYESDCEFHYRKGESTKDHKKGLKVKKR